MLRRTKILATLGPATDKKGVLESILEAGVNVVRINFSHGDASEHIARVQKVRNWAEQNHTYIGVLMDLQGPKIRIAKFADGQTIQLNVGDTFTLDADQDETAGNQESVGLSYKPLPQEVNVGNMLLLDDGKVWMTVSEIIGNKIICEVTQGGMLSDKKGINLRGGGLSANALTEKDKKDIFIAAEANADYVALSFPISGDDVRKAKQLIKEAGLKAGVIAKIERTEALEEDTILDIIKESAGIMVARGDLGVEIGDPLLPAQQKRLIKLARANDRAVITATQMLESMIQNPIPTRAEVFDVANAVLDGTDCVMLSAETAAGNFPVHAVKTMHEVCLETEKNPLAKISHHRLGETFNAVDETIAMATMYAANHMRAKAIANLTESGQTPLLASRISSNIPLYAISSNIRTLRKTTLYRGVYQLFIEKDDEMDWTHINETVIGSLIATGVVSHGDMIILTKGSHSGQTGGTNTIKILNVGSSSH